MILIIPNATSSHNQQNNALKVFNVSYAIEKRSYIFSSTLRESIRFLKRHFLTTLDHSGQWLYPSRILAKHLIMTRTSWSFYLHTFFLKNTQKQQHHIFHTQTNVNFGFRISYFAWLLLSDKFIDKFIAMIPQ